jgi:octaprenyl-diphosphate synthase
MESTITHPGFGTRGAAAGVTAGAPLTRIHGPAAALALVAAELGAAEVVLREIVHSDVAAVPAVGGYLVAAGGKRLRPALTALGARAIGFDRPIVRLMCVGEQIHLGSLLHDDVGDDGAMRRGKPAAHRVFGNAVSVLTGDFCLARAVLLAAEEGGHAAVTALAAAVTEMAEGEVLQLAHSGDLQTSLAAYLDVVDRKSAALIAWCAAAPALAAGNGPAAEALARFGRGVGIAFQISDDVLDYSAGTGKTIGADLRERKVTLPLLHALAHDRALAAELAEGPPDAARIPALAEMVRRTGALDVSRAEARRRAGEAVAALDALPAGPGRDALGELGKHLADRAS